MKRALLSILLLFIGGFAQAYDHKFIEMNPPKAKKPLENQVKRMNEIRSYKFSGYIGENDQALLEVHDMKKAKPEEQKKIRQLIEEENKDRKVIYKEIARHNKLRKDQEPLLIQNFFETYKNTSAKGTFYKEKGAWHKRY